MILEIDMGNTWTKWRVIDKQQTVCRGKTLSIEFPQSETTLLKNIDRVRLASVGDTASVERVCSALSSALAVETNRAETSAMQAGVTNSYQNPSSMGVDRWLAMLAAYNTAKRAVLVVSCGTAVTIDSVREDGIHEGGYILPGLIMMRDALSTKTGRVQYASRQFVMSREPGASTAAAVEHGAVHAVLSTIEQTYEAATSRHGAVEFFLTGGDALALRELLHLPCRCVEELVLDGLQYALP